jgi:hypothetical protein
MHQRDGFHDYFTANACTLFGDETGQAAVGNVFLKIMGWLWFHVYFLVGANLVSALS